MKGKAGQGKARQGKAEQWRQGRARKRKTWLGNARRG
jgi:hypothetical protein